MSFQSLPPRGWERLQIAIAYWTGLRLADSQNLLVALQQGVPAEAIRHRASKTGAQHAWPVPQWIRVLITPTSIPWTQSTDFARKSLRREIRRVCKVAKVEAWLPKHLRQRALTEWSRTGMAGPVVHGSGLRILNHYVDPLALLEAAAPRVRLPACFGAASSDTESLMSSYARIDPAGQRLIRETAQRLASG